MFILPYLHRCYSYLLCSHEQLIALEIPFAFGARMSCLYVGLLFGLHHWSEHICIFVIYCTYGMHRMNRMDKT